ncbi:MAG: hypothetical protein HYX75_11690 [Acidobacteria bacterium]|nr:hypothetical protein [Acidobacteriota bacterium]
MQLLPEAQRRGEITFKIAKSLSYDTRLTAILCCLAAGIAVQLYSMNAFLGAPLVFAASLLSLVSGYTNIPKVGGQGARDWKPVGRGAVERVRKLHEASRAWDQSALDITCGTGFVTLFGILAVAAIIALAMVDYPMLMVIWITDAVLLILPHWLTGVRRILTRPALIVKTKALQDIETQFNQMKALNEALQWMMEVSHRSEGEIPEDFKLMVKYTGAPEDFLGVQVQVALNDVSGTSFPYLYCVVLARPGFGLSRFVKQEKEIIEEFQKETDVELIVIRQKTTKTAGYHTKPAAQAEIFRRALLRAREVLGTVSKPTVPA